MSARYFLLLWLPCLCVASTEGQEIPYRRYTVHDGLVQQQGFCIFQDSRGYLWVGTFGGISKFDGENFENFTVLDGLPSPIVLSITEDSEGNVWVVTKNGLCKYDGISWKPYPRQGLEIDWRWWKGQFVGNLAGYKTVMLKDTSYVALEGIFPMLKDYSKKYVQGEQAFGVRNDLFFWKKGDRDTFIFYDGAKITIRDLDRNVYQLVPSPNGLLAMQRDTLRNKYYLINPYSLQRIDSIAFDGEIYEHAQLLLSNGDFYFVSADRLYCKKKGKSKLQMFNVPLKQPWQILEDQSGEVLWICDENGLVKLFQNSFEKAPHDVAPYPWIVVEGNNGKIWVHNYGYYLSEFDGKSLFKNHVFDIQSWNYCYFGGCRDSRGNLYFPLENGLLMYNGQIFSTVLDAKHEIIKRAGRGEVNLYTSYYDSIDHKILASGFHNGVYIIDEYRPEQVSEVWIEADNRRVSAIARDRQNNYWFGNRDGLVKYNVPTKTFEYFLQDAKKLPQPGIYTIFIDRWGTIWAGGWSGLFYFDQGKRKLEPVAENVILPIVFSITGNDSLLLVGGINGIYVMDLDMWHEKKSPKIRCYNHRNGFSGTEAIQQAAIIDSKGRYWIGAGDGLYSIPVARLSTESPPSQVRVTRLNGKRIGFQKNQTAELESGINQVKFAFEAIGSVRPLQTQYSFRLLGHNSIWSEWEEDGTAYFSNLSSGTYKFEVRSKNPSSEDTESYQMDSVIFKVHLLPWKQPWFFKVALGIVIFLASFLFWFYRRNRKAKAKLKEQEELIKWYQIQTLQAQLNPHFIFNLLNSIQSLIGKGENERAEKYIVNLSVLLRRFLDESVDGNIAAFYSSAHEVSLKSEIELLTMYLELEKFQHPGAFEYHIGVDSGISEEAIHLPPMLLQPFLENALKHGIFYRNEPGNVWVGFRLEMARNDVWLVCTIEDDGVGRKRAREIQEQSERIFKSRGSELVVERIRLLNERGKLIDIHTDDRPGGGTMVSLKVRTD